MGVESLLWRTPQNDETAYSGQLEAIFGRLRDEVLQYIFAQADDKKTEREILFDLQRDVRRKLHNWLDWHFSHSGRKDAEYMGLDPEKKFEVHTARFALRTKPDGGVVPQLLVTVLQSAEVPADSGDSEGPRMIFEGGSSIVADLRRKVVKYCIRKNAKSASRVARQQRFVMSSLTNARATYTRTDPNHPESEPFALLHRGL